MTLCFKVKWYKSGKEIMPSERFTIDVDGRVHRLTISNCFTTDGTEYTAKIDRSKTSAKLVVDGQCIISPPSTSGYICV